MSISGARDLLLQPPLAGRAVCRRVDEHVYSSLCFFPDQSSAPHFVLCVFSTLVRSRWVLLTLHTNLLTSGGDISRCAGGEVNGMSPTTDCSSGSDRQTHQQQSALEYNSHSQIIVTASRLKCSGGGNSTAPVHARVCSAPAMDRRAGGSGGREGQPVCLAFTGK